MLYLLYLIKQWVSNTTGERPYAHKMKSHGGVIMRHIANLHIYITFYVLVQHTRALLAHAQATPDIPLEGRREIRSFRKFHSGLTDVPEEVGERCVEWERCVECERYHKCGVRYRPLAMMVSMGKCCHMGCKKLYCKQLSSQ